MASGHERGPNCIYLETFVPAVSKLYQSSHLPVSRRATVNAARFRQRAPSTATPQPLTPEMKIRHFVLLVLGILLVGVAQAKPAPHRDGGVNLVSCLDVRCDPDSGPVCCIDASGFTRTFESTCVAQLAYCREGRYYVVVKQGEC